MVRIIGVLVLLILFGFPAMATPFDDLSSIIPEVRAAAAAKIRALKLYHPIDDDRWRQAERDLKKGQQMETVLKRFKEAHAGYLPDVAELPQDASYGFQLDDSWMLTVYFKNRILLSWHLIEAPREVEVMPPPHYTGTWMVYKLDGTAVRQNFRDGQAIPTA